ncbi:MAG TPA: sporulation protein YunB [Papillibacter sp.]|nr:sporulation protein YunB [Papillibacter sp.]
MPFRWLRRRRIYLSYYIKPMPRAKKAALIVLFGLVIVMILTAVMLHQLRPIVLQLAKSKVNETVLRTINTVIDREISRGAVEYSRLITLQKDINGNITALETNMASVNRLQTQISQGIVDELENAIISELRIPIGSAIGGELFSGRGPRMTVKILSVTYIRTKLENTFIDAGINQTRHKIILDVSVDVEVFVPGHRDVIETIETQVEVAETIIVGRVPNVYTDFGQGS